MSLITPQQDYSNWIEIIKRNLNNPTRNIVLIYDSDLMVGFFMYSISEKEIWNMEEIQIANDYQSKNNIFRKLYGFLITLLPNEIKTVSACAHIMNKKSQGILVKLGLRRMREDQNMVFYQGTYRDLLDWYNQVK